MIRFHKSFICILILVHSFSLYGFGKDSLSVKRLRIIAGAGFFKSTLVESANFYYSGVIYGRHMIGLGLMNGTTRSVGVWAGSGGWPLNLYTKESDTKSVIGGSIIYRWTPSKILRPLNFFLESRLNRVTWTLAYSPYQTIYNLDAQIGFGWRVCLFNRLAIHFNPCFGIVSRYGADPIYRHSYWSGHTKKM
jgi:hypothetical protein